MQRRAVRPALAAVPRTRLETMIFCKFMRSSAASLRLLCALLSSLAYLFSALAGAAGTPQGIGITYGQPAVPAAEFSGDLRRLTLPQASPAAARIQRPLLRGPASSKVAQGPSSLEPQSQGPLAPMPNPILTFAGISFNDSCTGGQCGGGWPPDPNGDVGPNHYIEAVNTAYAIYDKSGTRLAAFTKISCGAALRRRCARRRLKAIRSSSTIGWPIASC